MYPSDFPEIMVPVDKITFRPETRASRRPKSDAEKESRAAWSSRLSFTSFRDLFFSRHAPLSEKDSSSWLGLKPEGSSYNQIRDLEALGSDTTSSDGSSVAESTASASKKKQAFKIDARVISDAIIGLSDGLTVPFALTAGLSALGNTQVVISGGMAELIAGAISMGLGGYLGAKSEE